MPYYLDNAFLLDNPWITVVGCGGTGGFVAEGLSRLFQGWQATIVLVDHDRVEPHNLLRQNFYPEDVGKFKSQALADRLARAYRRPIGYSVYAFREEDSRPDGGRYPGLPSYGNSLLIGCADNAAARRAMAESLPGDPRRWLIDAGNDTNWGQVLIGNVADRDFGDEQAFVDQTCYLLPAPTVQRNAVMFDVLRHWAYRQSQAENQDQWQRAVLEQGWLWLSRAARRCTTAAEESCTTGTMRKD